MRISLSIISISCGSRKFWGQQLLYREQCWIIIFTNHLQTNTYIKHGSKVRRSYFLKVLRKQHQHMSICTDMHTFSWKIPPQNSFQQNLGLFLLKWLHYGKSFYSFQVSGICYRLTATKQTTLIVKTHVLIPLLEQQKGQKSMLYWYFY